MLIKGSSRSSYTWGWKGSSQMVFCHP